MREAQSKEIDGIEYRVMPLGASQGLRILAMLTRIVGPGLANMKSVGDAAAAIAGGIGAIAEQLNDADLDAVCKAMAGSTTVVLGPTRVQQLSKIFEEQFSGNYFAMFEWLRFALEVNYADFFRRLIAATSVATPAPADSAKAEAQ